MDIPEVAQAAALAEVATLGHERAQLLKQADDLLTRIKPSAIKAVQAGAGRNRVRELAGVSTTLWYEWLEEAGVQVRAKSTPAKKATAKKATAKKATATTRKKPPSQA